VVVRGVDLPTAVVLLSMLPAVDDAHGTLGLDAEEEGGSWDDMDREEMHVSKIPQNQSLSRMANEEAC